MPALEVSPPVLTAAAASYDDVAATLARIRASVRGAGAPSTGRSDTSALVAEVADLLAGALDRLGRDLTGEADRLRAAATAYLQTDCRVVRTR